MKTLTLLRHAKSDWSDSTARDIDRRLNERGRGAARAIGAYLSTVGLAFDGVLASPAVRVRETLDGVARGYGRVIDAMFDARIYNAPASLLLDLVRDTTADIGRLLLVGHNPGLGELAWMLDASDGPLRRAVKIKYPTGALVEIALDGETWAEAATGRITRFVRPRDLDAGGSPTKID